MPSPTNPNQIKRFVKNTLGCTCPDAVFDQQEFDSGIAISGIDNCKKLCIGERLLIYLIDTESVRDLSSSIPSLVSEGRKERDSRHLNRFRLVLGAKDVDLISKQAKKIFEGFNDLDDKVHLHVVSMKKIDKLQ
ncbi:MAG: hypothetical protein WBM38_02690 [Arenicellales bacterium]|jgi:hypothetical protein